MGFVPSSNRASNRPRRCNGAHDVTPSSPATLGPSMTALTMIARSSILSFNGVTKLNEMPFGLWAPSLSPMCARNKSSATPLFSTGGNGDDLNDDDDVDDDYSDDFGIENFEENRMDIVRILQKTYYRSMNDDLSASDPGTTRSSTAATSNTDTIQTGEIGEVLGRSPAKLDEATGKITNLPLWRVNWVETPGRRNCLNVHEGKYTHMFETILSSTTSTSDEFSNLSNEPLYFGHLFLPGGTASSKTGEDRYQLKTWREELLDEKRFDKSNSNSNFDNTAPDRSEVIGCLMQIIDHRRMEDGRLMILVQALERFVVDEILETRPYSVANVQVLLDDEDLSWKTNSKDSKTDNEGGDTSNGDATDIDENYCKYLRGKAVAASFYYHDYEFDKPKLPITDDGSENYLSKDDVPWIAISKLLPFAHYSSDDVSLDVANEKTLHVSDSINTNIDESEKSGSIYTGRELPIEDQLYGGGILWNPPSMAEVIIRRSGDATDCDTLETLLWLALDDFCRATRFELPEEVRCLVPPEMMDYLDISPPVKYLSPMYPKIRRQRRLSYHAPALIENLEVGKGMRQIWLNTPSTKARLLAVLERFDYLNNQLMGQFE